MKGLFGGVTYDALDGEPLFPGDIVGITWPDGSHSEPMVFLDRRDKDSDALAYVVDAFRGTTNRVYLRWKTNADVVFISKVQNRETLGSASGE